MSASASRFSGDALVRIATAGGRLVGTKCGTVSVFKGIPYALPPVGALRWRAPQRAPRWDGARAAHAPGPAPIQELPSRSTLLYRLNHDDAQPLVMSEDCLYLNVWTPEPFQRAGLPVLVWIHGGANRTGHGAQDLFDGSRLAARGIVVVTINMRLGALGFFSLPELATEDAHGASGNYGLQDILAALGWVQDNIASFGGDAARVTIAGNSAGAANVNHLMAAPAARGMFRAAIGQSLAGIFRPELRMTTQAEAAQLGRAALAPLGRSLEQLRDLPATAFLRIAPQGVIVDGRLLTEDSTDVFLAGRQARIPLLLGWNADEGSLYASPGAVDELLADCGAQVRARLDRIYPRAFHKDGHADRRALVGDRRFNYPIWRWARTHADTSGAPVWLYRFEHRIPLPDDLQPPADGGQDHGTFHTAELPYTWDNLGARPWAWSVADHAIAKKFADSWCSFVANADPNGGGVPEWKRFDAAQETHLMVFGTSTTPGCVARRGAFDIFDDLYFGRPQ